MNKRLEDAAEYIGEHWQAMLLAGVFILGLPFAVRTAAMQQKRQQARMAAYEQTLAEYKPQNKILIGDKVNGEVIDTVSEVAGLMNVRTADGKLLPLRMRTEYVAEINGIPSQGEKGYKVEEKQEMRY